MRSKCPPGERADRDAKRYSKKGTAVFLHRETGSERDRNAPHPNGSSLMATNGNGHRKGAKPSARLAEIVKKPATEWTAEDFEVVRNDAIENSAKWAGKIEYSFGPSGDPAYDAIDVLEQFILSPEFEKAVATFDPRNGVHGVASLRAFICAYCKNHYRGKTRSNRGRVRVELEITDLTDSSYSEEIMTRKMQLEELLSRLPEKLLIVVELHYFEGLSIREVAAKIGCPESDAKKRVSLALERLRKLIKSIGVKNHES